MNGWRKRILAAVLAAVMVLAPVTAYADEAFSMTLLSETVSENDVLDDSQDKPVVSSPDGGVKPGEEDAPEDERRDGLVIRFAQTDSYEYTGSPIRPEIEVRNDGHILAEGIDYTVKYSNNVKVSAGAPRNKQPKVTITGKGSLAGSASAGFTITKKNIDGEDIIKSRVIAVRGKKVPVPSLYYGGVKLRAGDFRYDRNVKFDTVSDNAQLIVTGRGNFRGSAVIPVKVVADEAAKRDAIRKFTVTIDQSEAKKLVYTGESLEKALADCIKVNAQAAGKADLTANAKENYQLIFPRKDAVINAGTVKFTVAGIGEYDGYSVTKTCRILPRTIDPERDILVNEDGTKTAKDGKVMINGVKSFAAFATTGAVFENLNLTYGSKNIVLREGRDYTVSYKNNKKAGAGKARYAISFRGNYKGRYISPAFSVERAELSENTASVVIPDMTSDGNDGIYKSKPFVSVSGNVLKASEYKVEYYTDESRTQELSADHKIKFQGADFAAVYVRILPSDNGGYELPTGKKAVEGSYRVWVKKDKEKDLSKAKITFRDAENRKVTKVDYTGKPVEPAKMEVRIGSGELKQGEHYTYKVVNNRNRGKASVVITAVDGSGYTGSKTAQFGIVSRNVTDNAFESTPKVPGSGKTLAVYFSWSDSGNTRRMAETIKEHTGADIYEIIPQNAYPSDYTATTEVALDEKNRNLRPPIKDLPESLAEYDRILVGYPIWWHTAPMIIGTFLENYDLSGVDIYPFSQSASMNTSQFRESMDFVRSCAGGAKVHDGLFARPSDAGAIEAYLSENGLIP